MLVQALTALTLSAATIALAAPHAAAIPPGPAPIPPGAKYVALGDSFSSGSGIHPLTDPGCARSSNNYPTLVAAALGLQLADVSCGGATIDNIVDTGQPTATGVCAPQIDAVTTDTELITMTIGGNDVNYTLDLFRNSCTSADDPAVPERLRPSICGDVDPDATGTALEGVQAEMIDMLNAVRNKAPRARIVLVDRITNLPADGRPCAGLPLTRDEIKYSANVARRLQQATKKAAHKADVQLVEISKPSVGHALCTSGPWVADWRFDPELKDGIAAYHPNATGAHATADLIIEQINGRPGHGSGR